MISWLTGGRGRACAAQFCVVNLPERCFLGTLELLLALIGVASLIFSIGTVCLIALFVILIPKNYFCGPEPPDLGFETRHPALNAGIVLVKNLLGAFLVIAGLALLVLPGQGILTILVGLVLLDFPGKRRLELRLIRRPKVLSALNWVRRKLGREPFVV